jgi:uncharacterized protein (DUF1778 family)
MPVQFQRTRSINVRLSEDEYLALERFCAASNARSMSDFVRKALQGLAAGANQENALISSVNEYSSHVKDLEEKVETLAAELAMLKAGARPHGVDGTDDSNEMPEDDAPECQPLDSTGGRPGPQ